MGKITGFIEFPRRLPGRRPIPVRVQDWREVYEPFPEESAREQGGRCMDCGIPFCHEGCPLGNLIPEWNDLVWRDQWAEASERLHATNNFPEFTGRLCPAPCEGACVLGINAEPVAIERVEYEIAERAFAENWVVPQIPEVRTGKSVAVVGSGPAGLACAQQLARAGHDVVVYERAERAGGLLRYGIPEFKMEKAVLDRRLAQLEAEGVTFRCSTAVGVAPDGAVGAGAGEAGLNGAVSLEPGERRGLGAAGAPDVTVVSATDLLERFDAVVLAGGATLPRDLAVAGRGLRGVHGAMEYLKPSNLVREGAWAESPITAEGKHVVIIGGGDTGADCLGTAHRQGAASVHQFEILPRPSDTRPDDNPWPTWPLIYRTSAAHEEGGERVYAVTTTAFVDDGIGGVSALRGHEVEMTVVDGRPVVEPVPGTEFDLPCELVLLAMGFLGAERHGVVAELGLDLDARGNVAADDTWATSHERVFVCGDMTRGQSLIVWAIAEGRSCAAGVDRALMGDTALPAPLVPGQLALR
ncbi:MAG TPA: glutamate synthase subunit beta [Acidimicrobiales bacterium]|jgi:glutamate synthase (NADPH/NADH) small chain|nr:glutamate synthase subunit beta [Acidimicrobiales bacterium]